jgi:hypothetical protein
MKTVVAALAVAVLSGCHTDTTAPVKDECAEFPYATIRDGRAVRCQVLWCNRGNVAEYHRGSGMAVLWCDDVK